MVGFLAWVARRMFRSLSPPSGRHRRAVPSPYVVSGGGRHRLSATAPRRTPAIDFEPLLDRPLVPAYLLSAEEREERRRRQRPRHLYVGAHVSPPFSPLDERADQRLGGGQ